MTDWKVTPTPDQHDSGWKLQLLPTTDPDWKIPPTQKSHDPDWSYHPTPDNMV